QSARHLPQNPQERSKREVSNVLKTLGSLSNFPFPPTLETLKDIHKGIMHQLHPQAGSLRFEASAIYDHWGNVVYITPNPDEMKRMLTVLLAQIHNQPTRTWKQQLILIGLCHYYFEKTHPFLDGNGLTGRVLLQYQLSQVPQFQDCIIPIEEYFETHKSKYYHHLEKNTRNLDLYITFFLEAVAWSLDTLLDTLSVQPTAQHDPISSLLPRRQELYYIIKDHPHITMDSIARRFPTIPKRTLSHDVSTLVKNHLVTKHGKTRGVVYSTT
ncbi:Fic family protein, partial [Candidatus Woesebacteria bacterium]|nr:Fic family protein [Candidatus Woesebacteria bacterium]